MPSQPPIFSNALQTSIKILNLFAPFFFILSRSESFTFSWNTKYSFGSKAFFHFLGTFKHELNITTFIYFIIEQVILGMIAGTIQDHSYSIDDMNTGLKTQMIISTQWFSTLKI